MRMTIFAPSKTKEGRYFFRPSLFLIASTLQWLFARSANTACAFSPVTAAAVITTHRQGRASSIPVSQRTSALPTKQTQPYHSPFQNNNRKVPASITQLRGGAMTKAVELVNAGLKSGPYGVLSLSAIASAVLVPLTVYRQAYSFSVGYGFSVCAMGLAMLRAFGDTNSPSGLATMGGGAPNLLLLSTIFYGFRLGAFLFLREISVPSKGKQFKDMDKSPRLKRIPFAIGVALFYSFMVCPVLYALRGASSTTFSEGSLGYYASYGGGALAWAGALLEAVADGQKFWAKRGKDESSEFVGPTSFVYRIVRHPNYLGEVVFWFGTLISGAPYFGTPKLASLVPWLCSSMGLFGIYGIMTGASKRLDGKQKEKYAGQEHYDAYRDQVKAPLFPFVTSSD